MKVEMKQLNILSKNENVIIISEKFNFIIENKIISTFLITLLINNARGECSCLER